MRELSHCPGPDGGCTEADCEAHMGAFDAIDRAIERLEAAVQDRTLEARQARTEGFRPDATRLEWQSSGLAEAIGIVRGSQMEYVTPKGRTPSTGSPTVEDENDE